MADVFISYLHTEREFAEWMSRGLEANGISVWWDRDIPGGSTFTKEIERELHAAKAAVVLWSTDSIHSDWVRDEAMFARDAKKLVPVLIADVQPPLGFRQLQAIALWDWNGDARDSRFGRIVHSIRLADRSEAPIVAQSAQAMRRSAPSRLRRGVPWAVAAAVAASAFAGLMMGGFRTPFSASSGHDQIEVGAIEVLRGGESADRFAKGLVDEFGSLLALNGVHTVSRNTSGQRSAELELRGSVDQSNDKYVVRADILSRPHQRALWSTTMQRDLHEFVYFQTEISTLVADVVECAIQTRSQLRDEPSVDTFVLLFRACGAQIGASPQEQIPEIARLIREAIPDDPFAYAACASANAWLTVTGSIKKPERELVRLRDVVDRCAAKAQAMGSRSGRWRYALGVVDDPARSFEQRESDLRAALEMDPDWRPSRAVLALVLDNVGRIREARVEYERLANEYPYQYEAHRDRLQAAISAAELGRMDVARPEFEAIAAAWTPSSDATGRWFNYEKWFGDPAIARKLLAEGKATARNKPEMDCLIWFLDARSSGTRPSEHEIDVACASGAGGDDAPQYIYGYFGYVDAALREMNARASTYLANASPLKTNYLLYRSYMRPVRADPRFMQFMARLGQVDYWLSTGKWPDFCSEETLGYDCKEAALAARPKAP